jgi:carboxypeptidase family protein
MRPHLRSLALPILIPLLLAACAGSAATPSPSGAGNRVDSAEAAAARVLSANPQFAGIGPLNSEMIGQCCWWEVTAAPGGYEVTIHVGWGDCPAGCIDKHEWTYSVSAADGSIKLIGETGPPVPAGVPGAGGGSGGTGTAGIKGRTVAGPVCPVVRANDPNCDPRPLPNAVVVVRSLDGTEVARTRTDASGAFQVMLPPGSYTVGGDDAPGFPIAPAPVAVTVVANTQSDVDLLFDTGIR